ncbi:PQQ-dependent sugar dehydrogenase [Pontibacter silvestris]|uniref:PQQ-dependent sugar dehydrogenase n=1 Tax=Pontibacter silvestris TaxID=2305183 RepID=A0ABW4X2H2_9BACT|nr:PQQ-dependent sugar dehydrogenase [Pontibacter silvestris]MCC9134827.1 PQQ-dependent sugar dehydrogenase [Pontibacter silvestris]
MKQTVVLLACLLAFFYSEVEAQTAKGPLGEVFAKRVIAKELSDPWEITYGPDQFLWVTEAKGYRVSRISPADGSKTVILDLNDKKNFPRYDKIPDEIDGGKSWPQGGLMGMALHPQLQDGKPYVYLTYVYNFAGADSKGNGSLPNYGGNYYTTRIVRYEYDAEAQKLLNPLTLCDTIPGSNDHNSGRLLIAPIAGKDYLFYTVGDMGAGQYDNAGRPNHAQDKKVYEGKVLRFNLEPDNDRNPLDKWIPNDNPFNNAVWSYGHRNAQGLAYAIVGGDSKIYSSEHGPFSDDEINIIEKGKNYGHPLVIGYDDNNYNGLAAGATSHSSLPGTWNTTYPFIENEHANVRAIGAKNYQNPIKTLYPLSNDFLKIVATKVKDDAKKTEWVSEAPSSIEVYTSTTIPGWRNSLLVPTLKTGKLIRLKLNSKGNGITGDTITYFKAPVRYRDVAISPDGGKLYLALDSTSVTSGPSEEDPEGSNCRGCIIEFTYQDSGTQGDRSKTSKSGLGRLEHPAKASPELQMKTLSTTSEKDLSEAKAKSNMPSKLTVPTTITKAKDKTTLESDNVTIK